MVSLRQVAESEHALEVCFMLSYNPRAICKSVEQEVKRMRAVWRDAVLAESDDTVVVEGNHYFPPDSIKSDYFRPSETHTTCPWKGEASYYDVVVDGETNRDAAWYYPEVKEAAANIKGRVAFWRGVKISEK